MANSTISFHFIIKKEKENKKGLAPIIARIRIDGKQLEVTTSRSVKPNLWLKDKESAKPVDATHEQLNRHLEAFRIRLYSVYSKLLLVEENITAQSFRQAISGKSAAPKPHTLIEATKEHNQQFEKLIGIKYSYGSYKNYKTTLKYLGEFVFLYRDKKDILLSEVDYKFCEAFFTWLTTSKCCKTNGANKQLQRLKKIIHFSIRSGYLLSNPMQTFTLKFKPVERVALSVSEIKALAELSLQRETLKKVRDAFLFQCYTGLSYSDIVRLNLSHLIKEGSGGFWIKMKRQKTDVSFSIPLLPAALEVLNRYLGLQTPEKPVFPILSNQKMNDALKLLLELAGISKSLTTHLARHTFATTITLCNGVPIETVSRMLGHTNLKTTQVYAKVLDSKIAHDMQLLKEKLQG